jgi:Flp pilus assembly protein TadG
MTPRKAEHQDEKGAVAILVALSMTLLFLFAAVAIDASGLGYNERRQDQSAADVGALAAVQFAVPIDLGNGCTGSGLTRSRCNGAMEAMAVANATLDDPSLADWADADKCPGRPAGFTVSPISPCVAFSANNQRAWVRIPVIEKPTTLARVVGIDVITVTADAVAGASIGNPGVVLPFLVPGNAASADYACLKAFSNPNFGPCEDLPNIGNFGAMDFYLYGNEDLQYTERCTGDTNGRFTANLARGVDHPLGIHPTGSGSGRLDQFHCPDFSAMPDMVYAQPGTGAPIESGMLYGGSAYSAIPYPGRIQDSGGFLVRGPQGSTAAARIDDTPLWAYLRSGLPGPCSGVTTPAEMETCISWAKNSGTEIFTDELAASKRFGFTPAVWQDDFSQGSAHPYHIKGFYPVYLDTTFYGCSANDCGILHTPGVADVGSCPTSPTEARITCGTPGGGTNTLQAVSAYILSPEIVPMNAKSPMPGADNQRIFNLIR